MEEVVDEVSDRYDLLIILAHLPTDTLVETGDMELDTVTCLNRPKSANKRVDKP
jgi:hypothetical protein